MVVKSKADNHLQFVKQCLVQIILQMKSKSSVAESIDAANRLPQIVSSADGSPSLQDTVLSFITNFNIDLVLRINDIRSVPSKLLFYPTSYDGIFLLYYPQTPMLNVKQAVCLQGGEAKDVCTSSECWKLAFICSDQGCECNDIHQNCSRHDMKWIMDKISFRLNKTVGPLQDLVVYYDQIIKMVMIEKNELLSRLDALYEMIFEEHQSKFMEAIEKRTVITGGEVQKVLSELAEENDLDYFQTSLLKQSNTTRAAIEEGLGNLKRIWRKKKKVSEEETRNKLREFQVRYVYVNGKWNKPLQISSSFKQLPLSLVEGYDLDEVDPTTVEGLADNCPKLHRLEIGVASSYTSIDDVCCQMIANELRQLTILKVHHAPGLTDRGALALASRLSKLAQLQLIDCTISEQTQQEIRKHLPNCEKIKF